MNDAIQIEAIRTQTLAQIEQIRSDPKPSYSIQGQRVDWNEYVESLQQTVDWCDRKLSDCSPFEFRTQGRS